MCYDMSNLWAMKRSSCGGFIALTNPQGDSNGCNWCYQNKAKCLDIKPALHYNNIIKPFGNYLLGKNKVWWGTGGEATLQLVNGERLACGVEENERLNPPISPFLFHSLSDNRLLSVWLCTRRLFKGLIAPNLSGKDLLLRCCKVATKL